MTIKVATWNVNSLTVRLPQVLAWLEAHPLDVLALQETKTLDENFPKAAFQDAGYHVQFSGQKTYNGVAFISREPPADIEMAFPNFQDPQRRMLAASFGSTRILNLYVPNGESVDSPKYEYKLQWLNALREYTEQQLRKYPSLILMGDFNIAPHDEDVHKPEAWLGKVLCSQPERDALQALLELGLQDCFRLFPQAPKSYSWWDYRMLAFRRNHGLRIDLILASTQLAALCQNCQIDKAPRQAERPSDHAPVIAEFR